MTKKRVFHGTPHVFSMGAATIRMGIFGPGFYFTTDLEGARDYAKGGHRRVDAPTGTPGIIECDVEFQNPIDYYDVFPWKTGARGPYPSTKELKDLRALLDYPDMTAQEAMRALKRLGYQTAKGIAYDGIIVDFSRTKDSSLLGVQFYVAFDPSSLSCVRRVA